MSEINKIFTNLDEPDLKQKIVEELLDNENNLEAKTELNKPVKWATLSVVREYAEDHKLKKSAEILKSFEKTAFTFLISHNREGRKEYVEALKSLSHLESEQDIKNPLNPLDK